MTAEFIEHRSPQTNKAKAPYNFVPLPEKVLPADEFAEHDKYHSDRHTGYIELEIKTETPLYTRCAYPVDIFSTKKIYVDDEGNLKKEFRDKDKPKTTAIPELQQFFHRGDQRIPVIPGSTLRGMTRSLVEIFSYSKIFAVSDKKLIHRSLADSTLGKSYRKQLFGKIKGGYLIKEGNQFKICPAKEIEGKTFVQIPFSRNSKNSPNFKDCITNQLVEKHRNKTYSVWVKLIPNYSKSEEITFSNEKIPDSEKENFHSASLVITGDMVNFRNQNKSKKHETAIFEINREAEKLPISDEDWRLFQEDLVLSRNEAQKPRKLKDFDNGEPVFYLVDESSGSSENKLVFFGLSKMFRLPYTSSIHDFINKDALDGNTLDYAESIFGTVDEKSKKIIASRVFFTDAICKTPNPFLDGANEKRRVPKILSSPKPTAFQLYLNQPEPDYAEDLLSYYDKGKTFIRGFKGYWHNNNLETNQELFVDTNEQRNINNLTSKQHTIIKPVKKGVNFGFAKVYFENLTKIELGALLTALQLPTNMRHQVGMAKPYGLGSILIKARLFLSDRKTRYQYLFENNSSWENALIEENADDFKKSFSQRVIEFCKDQYKTAKINTLQDIPRIRQLFELLSWKPNPNLNMKEYCNLQYEDRGKKKAEPQWKERYVLSHPEHLNNNDFGELKFFSGNQNDSLTDEDNSEKQIKVRETKLRNHTFQTRQLGFKKDS